MKKTAYLIFLALIATGLVCGEEYLAWLAKFS